MKKRTAMAGLLGAAVLCAAPAPSTDEEPALGPLKAAFEARRQAAEAALQDHLRAWGSDYRKALEALEARAQEQNDMQAWIACKKEMKRFLTQNDLAAPALVKAPVELWSIQRAALAERVRHAEERDQRILGLAKEYDAELTEWERTLTESGRREEAAAVGAERQRVQALLPKVATRPPEPLPPEPVRVEPAPAAPDVPPAAAGEGGPPEVRIFAEGTAVPVLAGVSFKKVPLTRTDFSPLAAGIFVSVACGHEEPAELLVRLTLRATPAFGSLSNVAVAVQYFGKPMGGQKADAAPAAVRRARLERLGASPVVLDFAPVWFGAAPGGGREFCGLIVSVFGAGEELLYQGVTARSLGEFSSPKQIGKTREELIADTRRQYEAVRTAFIRAQEAYLAAVDDERLKAEFKAARQAHAEARAVFDAEMARLTNAPPQ
jgi:hypothetical protein